MHVLTTVDVDRHRQLHDWMATVISAPYDGPGFTRESGPICPYTRKAMLADRIRTSISLAPAQDPAAVRADVRGAVAWFVENVPDEDWRDALVVGFPNIAVDDPSSLLAAMPTGPHDRFGGGVMVSLLFQTSPDPQPGSPWPHALTAPMPVLSVRYMAQMDARATPTSPALLAAYLERFGDRLADGRLTTVEMAYLREAAERFSVELPAA